MDDASQVSIPIAAPTRLHTASELAAALGLTKRAILLQLGAAPASGSKTIRGQSARAWAFAALPAPLQVKLETAALAKGFPDAPAFLSREQRELAAACEAPAPAASLHADLLEAFNAHLPERKNLSRADLEWLWAETLRHYEALAIVPPQNEARALKSSLIDFLLANVPGLARTSGPRQARALRRMFDRKLAAFTKGGRTALRDGRETKSGFYRTVLCPGCLKMLVDLAILHGGTKSLAWCELKKSGRLCFDCASRHRFNVREYKSYVPHSVRKAVTPVVDAALPWLKSDAAGRMAGPYIPRDYSDTVPGDYFVGDDVTWNHEIFSYDLNGCQFLHRVECIYFGDERTSYPLGFLLIAGHYNSRHIRRALLNVHDLFGLPHKGLKLENGVWSSRTVRDETDRHEIRFRENEDGLKTFGELIGIRHALPRNPRTKVVEGDFKILQERMRREPGFVGFNERAEKSDTQKDFERRVRTGKEDARNGAMSFEELRRCVSAILQEFANEPQNGSRNPGRSPAEAWREGVNAKPLRKLPLDARWIFATSRRRVTVTTRGILLPFNKNEKWTYADDKLARFLGREVWAYYHLDCPELLTVSDFKRTEFMTIKGIRLPANTATPEQLSEAHRQIAEFNRTPKTIAGAVVNPLVATITRDNDFTPEQLQIGRGIEADKAAYVQTVKSAAQAKSKSEREDCNLLREALAEIAQRDKEE